MALCIVSFPACQISSGLKLEISFIWVPRDSRDCKERPARVHSLCNEELKSFVLSSRFIRHWPTRSQK